MVEVEVALSIAVNIPAPDGYEDMEENEIMAATLERLQDSTEYIDAYSNLHNIVKFHRDTYPNAKASFTPVMGLIDGEEI